MKKITYLLFVLSILLGCKKNDEIIPENKPLQTMCAMPNTFTQKVLIE